MLLYTFRGPTVKVLGFGSQISALSSHLPTRASFCTNETQHAKLVLIQ